MKKDSWHGFERIQLPEGKKHLSRKMLSIYLYTRDRPGGGNPRRRMEPFTCKDRFPRDWFPVMP